MSRPSRKNRAGMAMMLVMVAVALAAVLGYATLASVGTQTQISESAAAIKQADCLAESGFNFAMYEIENDSAALLQSGGENLSNLSVGSNSSGGTFNVAITRIDGTTFKIVSAASVTGATLSNTTINRSVSAVVQLTAPAVQPNQAAGFNTPSLILGLLDNVAGDVRSTGAVSLLGQLLGGNVMANSTSTPPASVTDFSTYSWGGQTYVGTVLTTSPVAGTVLGPTATNPAGVYYSSNQILNLNGVTINGSLIIKSGGVQVTGASTNTITPVDGFPGLVINKGSSSLTGAGYLRVNGNNEALTVNGVLWSQYGIDKVGLTNTNSEITVNGSLLIPTTSPLHGYLGGLSLTFTAGNVNVPNFSSTSTIPKTVRVVSWSQ